MGPVTPAGNEAPAPQLTEDPYEGWKEYTNATYGFKYKYPSDSGWRLTGGDTKSTSKTLIANGFLLNSGVAFDDNPIEKGEVNVFEVIVAKKGSVQGRTSDEVKSDMEGNELYELVPETTVEKNGVAGKSVEFRGRNSNLGTIRHYFFEKNGNAINITINYLGVTNKSTDVSAEGEKIYQSLTLAR